MEEGEEREEGAMICTATDDTCSLFAVYDVTMPCSVIVYVPSDATTRSGMMFN